MFPGTAIHGIGSCDSGTKKLRSAVLTIPPNQVIETVDVLPSIPFGSVNEDEIRVPSTEKSACN